MLLGGWIENSVDLGLISLITPRLLWFWGPGILTMRMRGWMRVEAVEAAFMVGKNYSSASSKYRLGQGFRLTTD